MAGLDGQSIRDGVGVGVAAGAGHVDGDFRVAHPPSLARIWDGRNSQVAGTRYAPITVGSYEIVTPE